MNLNSAMALGLSLLIVSSVSQAQSVSYPTSDIAYVGSAKTSGSTEEIILSEDGLYNQYGEAWLPGEVCAKEFTVEFDVLLGNKAANQGGGAGLGYQINSARDSKYLNRVNFNIQDRARIANYNTAEVFKYFGTETFPGNGNLYESLNIAKPAFNLSDGVWRQVKVKIDETTFTVIMKDPLVGSMLVASGARTYKPGTPIKQFFYAWTGSARNKFAVRNVKSTILRSDNCSGLPSLGTEEAKESIASSCGVDNCAGYQSFFACAIDAIGALKESGAIDESTEESLVSDYENKLNYCTGSVECKADLENQLANEYQLGFTAGVSSVPVDSIRSESYNQGFEAGKNAVLCPVDSGNKEKEGKKKITICHFAANGKGNTISISENAWQAHQKHGDVLGECPKAEEKSKDKAKK